MPARAPIVYTITAPQPQQHLFHIELQIAQAQPGQRLSLPVWIPGSYLVREFAQHLQGLQDGTGQPIEQINKNTWVLPNHVLPDSPVTLRYQVYALDRSVRTAYLDTGRAFFNPTSLCLRVEGQETQAHQVHLPGHGWPSAWAVATALPAQSVDAQGWGHYQAQDYDELADSPWEVGRFWQGSFESRGSRHVLVVSGADPDTDWGQLLSDTERICATQVAFWHPDGSAPPWQRYVFLLHASHDGYGGLEHRHSTALICQRNDLPRIGTQTTPAPARSEGYLNLLGLISHEYFHTWNVKRLRPQAFTRYDYNQENYTTWLWFFEGFTSYYDELLLWRAGLIDEDGYLKRLSKTINQVLQTPGRHVQSVAQASFEAWTKYYRTQENTPNATVSYYTKGALIALCLDLSLRTSHPGGLDVWMQTLFKLTNGGPMAATLPSQLLIEWGREDLATALDVWVHGTDELPLEPLLQSQGIGWKTAVAPVAQVWGVRLQEQNGGLWVKNVMRGSAAELAGMVSGDEWIGWHVAGEEHPRRLQRLNDLGRCPAASGTAWVARDGRLFALHLCWPGAPATTVELERVQENQTFWPCAV